MAAQYSYVIKDLNKTFPGAPKPILKELSLQFYPDAKIAIIGPNGSGKSTLMKIMAGRDTEFTGEAWAGEGIRVGYLEQEPQLDEAKTVKENVMDAVAPVANSEPPCGRLSGIAPGSGGAVSATSTRGKIVLQPVSSVTTAAATAACRRRAITATPASAASGRTSGSPSS